jgi:retinol dehydrogenase 12
MVSEGALEGQLWVVTGATSGIGQWVAEGLARGGAHVVLVGRDRRRLDATEAWIRARVPRARLEDHLCDLSLLADVRKLAEALSTPSRRIRGLVNDAGGIFLDRRVTSEGHERTWALNVLAPFLLTRLLLPSLSGTPPGRVVNVSSAAHRGVRLDLDDPEGRRQYRGYARYSRSKLAVLMLTYEFARRVDRTLVTFNAVHPGLVASRFGHDNPGLTGAGLRLAVALFGISPARGSRTPLYVATSPEIAAVTGAYFSRCRAVPSSTASHDADAAAALWQLCEREVAMPSGTAPPPARPLTLL